MIEKLLILLLAFTLLVGCAAKTVDIQPQFEARKLKVEDGATGSREGTCVRLEDSRKDVVSHYKSLSKENAIEWLENAVLQLSDIKTTTSVSNEHPTAPVIKLRKAYVKHLTTTISGVVVLSIESGGTPRYFRGQFLKNNWWGANSEYEYCLDKALHEALTKVLKDETFAEALIKSNCS